MPTGNETGFLKQLKQLSAEERVLVVCLVLMYLQTLAVLVMYGI